MRIYECEFCFACKKQEFSLMTPEKSSKSGNLFLKKKQFKNSGLSDFISKKMLEKHAFMFGSPQIACMCKMNVVASVFSRKHEKKREEDG